MQRQTADARGPLVISKECSLAMTASQPMENQQHSSDVSEKKHDMEGTTATTSAGTRSSARLSPWLAEEFHAGEPHRQCAGRHGMLARKQRLEHRPSVKPLSGETAMPFYHKGDVRIRYEEAGSGFPLLVTPVRHPPGTPTRQS